MLMALELHQISDRQLVLVTSVRNSKMHEVVRQFPGPSLELAGTHL